MHAEKWLENMVIKGTTRAALQHFSKQIDWPPHVLRNYPDLSANLVDAARQYFVWSKGTGGIADFLPRCNEGEIPTRINETATLLKDTCVPPPPQAGNAAKLVEHAHPEANVDAPY